LPHPILNQPSRADSAGQDDAAEERQSVACALRVSEGLVRLRRLKVWITDTRPSRMGRSETYHRALSELAVFAAPAVEADIHRAAIPYRLTAYAGPNSRQCTAAAFRNLVTAFQTMGLCLARWHTRPCSQDPVRDGIVNLILHRPVRGPPACHGCFPRVSDFPRP
jgi:hypothetical protein